MIAWLSVFQAPFSGIRVRTYAAAAGAVMATMSVLYIHGAEAAPRQSFVAWRQAVADEAIKSGVDRDLVEETILQARFIPRIIELDRKQPEKTITFAKYAKNVLPQARIKKGRELYHRHRNILRQVERKYGVPAEVVVALWGIETNYGHNTGGFKVIDALATLGYDGRRSAYFRGELLTALKILDQGHIVPDAMKGSWAGAMGQNQFMPSSFMRMAVDGDGDGHRDIWRNLPDVFASSAHYLAKSGWKRGQPWGQPVQLSTTFNKSEIGLSRPRSIRMWESMGITLKNNKKLTKVMPPDTRAYLVQPDGPKGVSFIVYDNYKVIMAWNRSTYFATSVGMLSDLIKKDYGEQ